MLLGAASVLWVVLSAAQMQDDLAEAEDLLQAFKYDKAVSVLSQALSRTDASTDERSKAYALIGVGYFQMGDEKQARAAFKEAVVLNKDIALPPLTSPKITRVFDRIKSETLPKPKLDEPPPPLPPRPEVVQLDAGIPWSPPVERSYTALYVGIGVATVALASGIVMGLNAKSQEAASQLQPWGSDSQAMYRQAQGSATAATLLFCATGASLGVGALVTFVF
jgi:tetratricopeptide (TPR) repeat protein